MLTLFTDVTDIRELFKANARELGSISSDHKLVRGSEVGYHSLTENDFKSWLFSSIDFLGVVLTDFQFDSGVDRRGHRTALTNYSATSDLYRELITLMNYPELVGREISSCTGYLKGDLLCFQMEFIDE